MNIGYFLKKIRTDKSLTLNEVARSTGMTASLISQIENEKVYPSLNSLEAILLYYGVELSDFFEQVERKNFVLIKLGSAPRVESGSPAEVFSLNPCMYDFGSEWFQVDVPCGGRFDVKKSVGKIAETSCEMRIIFMASGTVTVEIGNETFDMSAGDTLCFRSFLPVAAINPFEPKARFILSGKHIVVA
jgi:transcriptional regulator with XRE-family HTH domain